MATNNDRTFLGGRVRVLALATTLLAGCAAYPVQEMSDARQTIRAAEAAGAASVAPERLAVARDDLRRAEQLIRVRNYRSARRAAEAAHDSAADALAATQKATVPR